MNIEILMSDFLRCSAGAQDVCAEGWVQSCRSLAAVSEGVLVFIGIGMQRRPDALWASNGCEGLGEATLKELQLNMAVCTCLYSISHCKQYELPAE